ncbi:MAG: sugar phosphate nucleotidyltransferase [Bdellovibrionota bacterium]
MQGQGNVWAIVLAAGEGSRLRSLTTTREGVSIPKQFCSFGSGPSLLRQTIERAGRIVPKERIVTVVAAQHRQWWESELFDLPAENVVVQPQNRGTAPGILLPVLHVIRRDPKATVLVFPSDHYIGDEETVLDCLRFSAALAAGPQQPLVLLGITPDEPDPQYGWIVPARKNSSVPQAVECFVEKPGESVAAKLMEEGALWSSFLFAASARTLLKLFKRTLAPLYHSFCLNPWSFGGEGAKEATPEWLLEELYRAIPVADFSRDVLEKSKDDLLVFPVPVCDWSDLGTPARIGSVFERRGTSGNPASHPFPRAVLDLCASLASRGVAAAA